LHPIGKLPGGQIWSNGNAVGALTAVPGSGMRINATTLHMDDSTVTNSEHGGSYELSARGMLETDDGYYISVSANGLLYNTPHVQAVLTNETGVQPTKWGELETLTNWRFQASGKYADLTGATFFANIRMFPSDNAETKAYVEYRLSKVLPGPGCPELTDKDGSKIGEL
jgi:hypothetical protein